MPGLALIVVQRGAKPRLTNHLLDQAVGVGDAAFGEVPLPIVAILRVAVGAGVALEFKVVAGVRGVPRLALVPVVRRSEAGLGVAAVLCRVRFLEVLAGRVEWSRASMMRSAAAASRRRRRWSSGKPVAAARKGVCGIALLPVELISSGVNLSAICDLVKRN